MVREPRTRRRRIGLNGIPFIEQPLLIELRKHPPQGLDIFVVVGDIGVLHIDPITHLTGQFVPQVGVLHHRLTAGAVVLLDGDFLPDILFGYPQFLLHAQFDRQPVGIPSRLAMDKKSLLSLVATEYVLYRPSHHVVNPRHPVGRGRSLVKNKGRMTLTRFDTLMKGILPVPLTEHLGGCPRQVQPLVFRKFLTHGDIFVSAMEQRYYLSWKF